MVPSRSALRFAVNRYTELCLGSAVGGSSLAKLIGFSLLISQISTGSTRASKTELCRCLSARLRSTSKVEVSDSHT